MGPNLVSLSLPTKSKPGDPWNRTSMPEDNAAENILLGKIEFGLRHWIELFIQERGELRWLNWPESWGDTVPLLAESTGEERL